MDSDLSLCLKELLELDVTHKLEKKSKSLLKTLYVSKQDLTFLAK